MCLCLVDKHIATAPSQRRHTSATSNMGTANDANKVFVQLVQKCFRSHPSHCLPKNDSVSHGHRYMSMGRSLEPAVVSCQQPLWWCHS